MRDGAVLSGKDQESISHPFVNSSGRFVLNARHRCEVDRALIALAMKRH